MLGLRSPRSDRGQMSAMMISGKGNCSREGQMSFIQFTSARMNGCSLADNANQLAGDEMSAHQR